MSAGVRTSGLVLAFALGAGCKQSPPPRVALACPSGTELTLDSTVEGKDTWWACRRDGRPDGPSLMTYADGRPRNAGAYRAGEMHGRWTHWSTDGRVEADGFWANGKREGRWAWNDSSGSRIEEYANGKQVGRFTRSYADGTIAEQGDYVNGEKVGRWRTWDARGHLEIEEHYVNGQRNGLSRRFHPSGQLASTLEYAADVPVGRSRRFYESGAKESEGDFVAGEPSGRWTEWEPDGRVASEGNMVKGKRHGDWRIGNATVHFENGREGRLRPCPLGSTEKIECVARCCDVSARWCELPDGKRVGPFDSWTVDGRLQSSNATAPASSTPRP